MIIHLAAVKDKEETFSMVSSSEKNEVIGFIKINIKNETITVTLYLQFIQVRQL